MSEPVASYPAEARAVPAFHACDICGDLAVNGVCITCERLAQRYDAQYHARRSAELFGGQPRAAVLDDGLGALRGAAAALKITAVVSLIAFFLGLILAISF